MPERPTAPLPPEFAQWLDYFEWKLRSLEAELAVLRERAAAYAEPAPPVPEERAAPPPVPSEPAAAPVGEEPAAAPVAPQGTEPAPAAGWPPVAPARTPARSLRETMPSVPRPSMSDLVGARALAWAGGGVTLLGIIFFFVLAVDRGWVSEELRVVLGALTSAALYGAALYVRRRYGNMVAALAAAGTAIAGGYATLVAATALYDFLSEPQALLVAAGIAAVGVATALVWDMQMTAALGLVGAMLGPPLVQGETTLLGVGFAAVVLAATVGVGLARDWPETLIAGGLTSAIQAGALLAERDAGHDWPAAALTGVFALLYLGAGVGALSLPTRRDVAAELRRVTAGGFVFASIALVAVLTSAIGPTTSTGIFAIVGGFWLLYLLAGFAYQLRSKAPDVDRVAASLIVASVAIAFWATYLWFEGSRAEGLALLVAAAVYLALLPLLAGRGQRNLASVLWAAGFAVAAVAVGELLSGQQRALVWAAQGALLSFVAVRTREPRLQLASAAYVLLALAQTLVFDAPPSDLFVARSEPASGIPAVLFVALASAVVAYCYRRQPGVERRRTIYRVPAPTQGEGSLAAVALCGAATLYAAALAILGLFQLLRPDTRVVLAFEEGHAAVTSVWSAVALALLLVGLYRGWRTFHWAGLAIFGVVAAKLLLFDLGALSDTNRSYSLLAVGVTALAAGFFYGRLGERFSAFELAPARLHPFTVVFVLGSALVAVPALVELLDGKAWAIDRQGVGLLVAAAAYGALATLVFGEEGRRDLSTMLWGIALVLVAGGLARDLLDGQWLVLAWAVGAAVLAWLAERAAEERFAVGSLAYLATAFGYAFVLEAPPSELFFTNAHPANGVPSIAAVTLAGFAFAYFLRRADWRRNAFWAAGAVAVYGASLSILGFFQWVAEDEGESIAAAFQRGHTAVSSFWGVVGLALLALGLAKHWTAFRPAGLALFAVALAKIFLYDLSNLSSMARALSFLGVGTVLLFAAFLYQRLTEQTRERST